MAIYVKIVKDFEDDQHVIYKYGPSDNELFEKLKVTKTAEEFTSLEDMTHLCTQLHDTKTFHISTFLRAMSAVLNHMKDNNNEDRYPQELIRAS